MDKMDENCPREKNLEPTNPPKVSYTSRKSRQSADADTDQFEKKNKLRTSKDVYDRLKWAAGTTEIDVSSVYIGYEDRFLGICEIAFNDYDPNESDIPYHRIHYFRSGGPAIMPQIGEHGEIRVRESNWPKGSIIQWDRKSRIDLIFKSGETLTPNAQRYFQERRRTYEQPQFHAPRGFREVPFYKFNRDLQQWKPVEDHVPQSATLPRLKIVSFNVLFELYDPEVVQCTIRWPYLIDFLEATNADMIALQEVTPAFMTLLQNQPWVQQQYYLTDTAKKRETIYPYGQILLTKFPPAAVFSSKQKADKRWVIPTYVINNQVLQVPVIHLKSDHNDTDHSGKRKNQLINLIRACESSSITNTNVIILGDTNFKNEESIAIEELKSTWIDIWPFINNGRSGENEAANLGCTYNTIENPLAKQICKRLNAQFRFDRIFMNSNSTLLKPVYIQVIGKELIDFSISPKCIINSTTSHRPSFSPLPLSDHYGLGCEFELTPPTALYSSEENRVTLITTPSPNAFVPTSHATNRQPNSVVYTSAVVIIPPEHVWERIQKIRSEFDPSYERWMPHMNLLYGFVPDDATNFDEAEEKFTEVLKSMPSFTCKLSDLGIFNHGKSCTVYLQPDPMHGLLEIKKLQSKLHSQYPFCSEQSEKSPAGFTPHLSIAKLTKSGGSFAQIVAQRMNKWRQELFTNDADGLNNEFMVETVHIISRTGNHPFEIRKTINLGAADSNSTINEVSSSSVTGTSANNTTSPLHEFLISHNLLPTAEREASRFEVFRELQDLCNQILSMASHRQDEFKWNSVHLIGSGALNCHTDGSDIDALCCGFDALSHEQFFDGLKKALSSSQFRLKLHHIVLDTLVPIAKLSMDRVEIDLVYSTCPNPWNLKPRELDSLTEMNVRSVAGIRDVMKLNEIIPENCRSSFQMAVRAIKFWAKARHIHSKGFGYLGGYPWTLLAAYVLRSLIEDGRLEVRAVTPEELLTEFFYQFTHWKWSDPVEFTGNKAKKNRRSHNASGIPELMPVLAPAYPYINSARNVTRSTRNLIRKEFKRGHEILSQKPTNFEQSWREVSKQATFFDKYSRFIHIQIRNESEHSSQICAGFLDSKLVSLLVYLEKMHTAYVQPYTKIFIKKENETGHTLTAFVGLEPQNAASSCCVGDLSDAVDYFQQKFQKWTYKPIDSVMHMEVLDKTTGKHCDILNQFIEIMQQTV